MMLCFVNIMQVNVRLVHCSGRMREFLLAFLLPISYG